MRLLRHICRWVGHHSGSKPKVTDEQMARLTIYPEATQVRKYRLQPPRRAPIKKQPK